MRGDEPLMKSWQESIFERLLRWISENVFQKFEVSVDQRDTLFYTCGTSGVGGRVLDVVQKPDHIGGGHVQSCDRYETRPSRTQLATITSVQLKRDSSMCL